MNTLPSKQPRPGWFIYLFFGIFLLVGSGCLVTAAVKLVKTINFVATASATTGTVIDFKAHRGSKSTTYAPVVSYVAPDGNEITFDSAISSGSPDYAAGETVPVLFNPSDPATAEIDAFIPLWFPFIIMGTLGTCFTAFPIGWLVMYRRSLARDEEMKAALAAGLSEWQANPEWRGGQIRWSIANEIYFFGWFALLWNCIALPTGFMSLHEFLDKGNRLAIVGLLFPLVGAFLAWQGLRRYLQRRRFGDLVISLDSFPPAVDREITGRLALPLSPESAQGVQVTLVCSEIINSRRSSGNRILQTLPGSVNTEAGPAGTTLIHIHIPLPPGMEPTSSSREWTIRITGALPGIDLDAGFVIPLAPAATLAVTTGQIPTVSTPQPIPASVQEIKNGTMSCPKCGYVQAIADECSACHIIIAKYRSRPVMPTPRKSVVFPLLITIFIVFGLVTLVVGGSFAIWQTFYAQSSTASVDSTTYTNSRYGLTLSLPEAWKRYSVKEAISCATLRDEFSDQYLLLASPTTPAETLLVVNISGLSLDYFRSSGWEGVVADYNSRNPVRFSEVLMVGGFQLHRMGYNVAGFYREDALFEAGGELLEIYFYLPDGDDAATRAGEIRNFINAGLRKL